MSARSIRRSHEREAERRGRRLARRSAGAAAAVAAAAVVTAPGAEAANFTVSNTNDAGVNSLRQAVINANGTAGPDTISFSGAGASGEIRLATEIAITDDLTINGPGAGQLAISGDSNNNNLRDFATSNVAQGDTRIFHITDATSPGSPLEVVSISGLTLKEGVADRFQSGLPYTESGGAIYSDEVDLRLSNLTVTDNVATDNGGGVSTEDDGRLSITNSTFSGNRARAAGGAIYSEVEKYQPGSGKFGAQITGSQVTGNTAGGTNFGAFGYSGSPDGGGIEMKYGQALISNTTIAGNTALTDNAGTISGESGGLGLVGGSRVENSTISGNTAGTAGGGISMSGSRLLASTVSGNTVVEGAGGGVFATPAYFLGGRSRIDLSTISGNAAGGSGTGEGYGGGVIAVGAGDTALQVRNSTIAANTAAARAGGVTTFSYGSGGEPVIDLQATIVADNLAAGSPSDTVAMHVDPPAIPTPVATSEGIAAGFSLVETPGATVLEGAPAGSNITGVDPKLGPLGANGGPTQTQTLAPTSAAIDSAQANGFTTDQTGGARTVEATATNAPLSDGTDIGAVELNDPAAVGGDPDTAFDKKPPKKVKAKGKKGKKVKLTFSGTINSGAPAPLGFECKIDKGKFEQCASPLKLKLAKGKHTIEIRAVDSTGRVDSTPAKAKIKVKKKKPKK